MDLKHLLLACILLISLAFQSADAANSKTGGNSECVPFVSQYTDCSDANRCLGCKRCSCTSEGRWSCNTVQRCSGDEPQRAPADADLRDALAQIQDFLQDHPAKEVKHSRGKSQKLDSLIVEGTDDTEQGLSFREKRSSAQIERNNRSIVFHHTTDELNEDTLKNSTHLGTIPVQKVKPVKFPETRRMGVYMEHNSNLSALDSLHIEFNHPQAYARHVTDNKLDSTHGLEHHDALSHDKLHVILSNTTQAIKDKDLSKVVVNELKEGQEHIGEKNAPIMSNITFTPENDTLTAIAFIAGNLLNKLWSIEKYEGDESVEVQLMKHEKIAELLDLFKDPMTMKQEMFLKTALEKLSDAVDKNKEIENISICKNVEKTRKEINSTKKITTEAPECDKHKEKDIVRTNLQSNISPDATDKIRNILDLAERFEHVQKNLDNLKLGKPLVSGETTEKAKNYLSEYGELLQKLTKILLPSKSQHKKRIVKKVKSQQVFSNNDDFTTKVYQLYGIDLGDVSLTPKDRLLMDYLLNVEKAPDCILGTKTRHSAPASKIEGEILFNLSEFFKVRSFVDLMKLIGTQKQTTASVTLITTEANKIALRTPSQHKSNISRHSSNQTVTLASTKEKLKNHLKSIIEDLTELQNVKGVTRNLSIADLLPCLSNLLAGDNSNNNQLVKSASKKIQEMFKNLESENAVALPTRRILDSIHQPKSAVIWERIVQSFERMPTRRLLENPKILTFQNLKELMKLSLEKNNLKSYKNVEDFSEVLPSDKLVFLKSIRQDCSRLKDVLEAIGIFVENTPALKSYDAEELETFIRKVMNILHIAQNLFAVLKVNKPYESKGVIKLVQRPQLVSNDKNKILSLIQQNKLTREQILNQLLKNRIELFIRAKEASGNYLIGDISYDIALRALKSLKTGDYTLARELYMALAKQKLQKEISGGAEKEVTAPTRFSVVESPQPQRPPSVARFEEPRQTNQDQLLQQLLSLKLR